MPLGCSVQAGITHGQAVVPGPPEAGAGHCPGCAQDCGEVPVAEGSAGREEPGTGRAGWHPALSAAAGAAPARVQEPAGTAEALASPLPLQVAVWGCWEQSAIPRLLQMALGHLSITPWEGLAVLGPYSSLLGEHRTLLWLA